MTPTSYNAASTTFTVTVIKLDLKNATFKGTIPSGGFVYDGTPKIPQIELTYKGTTLVEGTDYTISFPYNDNVNARNVLMRLIGQGKCSGTLERSYLINKAYINEAQVEGLEGNRVYTGERQEPSITVKLGDKLLRRNSDYSVHYNNNQNAGTARVDIHGMGNYTGHIERTFTITPASIENAEVSGIEDKTYNGQAQTQTPVVTFASTTLEEGTDYTFTCSNNLNAGTGKVTFTAVEPGNFTGSVDKTFTIDKAAQNFTVEAAAASIEIGKTTKVIASGAKETTEYTFTSSDTNIAEVDAEGTVTGKTAGEVIITAKTAATANYKEGAETVKITVTEPQFISIEDAEISGLTDRTYNGNNQTQTPVVKLKDGTILTEGTDYTVSYANNKNAGTATVIITGKGNYEKTASATFKITKAAQNFTVKAAAASIDVGKTTKVTASGAKESPRFTFTSSNANIAAVNSAGTVTGKAAGTVTITVKAAATANYKELSKTVKITVNKVLKKPGNCHFIKWNNTKYTGCRIGWNKTAGADGYQTLLSWTDGSHASSTIVKSTVLYRDCTVHPQHVSQMKVRAFYMQNGQRKYGPWSNVEYITPSPAKLTTRNTSSGSNLKMSVSWNIIYGCNGYNVFITTNPNGKWYWNQSTPQNATATSAVIDKCGGSKLKKNTRYYVRIVTRRKRNGVFCTVPMPAGNTYVGSFIIK